MRATPSIAVSQGGVFSRSQARAVGFSYSTMRRRLEAQVWREIAPDVFCETGHDVGPRGLVFAAALSTKAVVSHWSAALMHRLEVPADRAEPTLSAHVTSSRPLHVNVPGVAEHRLRVFSEHTVEVDGIAVTRVDRTVVDLLATLPVWDARTLLFRAVQQGWLSEAVLLEHIRNRSGWHGTPQLRELSGLLGTGAHALSEKEAHNILERAGIAFEANVRIVLQGGRIAVVDLLIKGTRIAIEIDGFRYHSSDDRFQDDRDRQNALVAAGFTVLRFTWVDITQREAYVIETITRHLAGRPA